MRDLDSRQALFDGWCQDNTLCPLMQVAHCHCICSSREQLAGSAGSARRKMFGIFQRLVLHAISCAGYMQQRHKKSCSLHAAHALHTGLHMTAVPLEGLCKVPKTCKIIMLIRLCRDRIRMHGDDGTSAGQWAHPQQGFLYCKAMVHNS